MSPEEWIPLAEIARPHGVRGEVRLKLFNKISDTLLAQDEVLVRLPNGYEHEVSVDAARRADEGGTGVPTRGRAQVWDRARVDGMTVPRRGEVAFLLPDGPAAYRRGRLAGATCDVAP